MQRSLYTFPEGPAVGPAEAVVYVNIVRQDASL